MSTVPPNPPAPPITEADLHAWVDGQLAAERAAEVEAYLAVRPEEAARVVAWRAQSQALHAAFDAVLDEPWPARVRRAGAPAPRVLWPQAAAAAVLVLVVGAACGWWLRGATLDPALRAAGAGRVVPAATPGLDAFARRAAVAHAVYAPEVRRPVEVDAAHEEQLVRWLSRRLAAPLQVPDLAGIGYALEGGRLLPGGQGPVAQFMYRDANGMRLTLYVSNELGLVRTGSAGAAGASPIPGVEPGATTAFRFASEGRVNVFYWVDGPFGYALSTEAERGVLERASRAVWAQLQRPARADPAPSTVPATAAAPASAAR